MKVLHCPEIVGGNAQQLSRSERDLGIHSQSIVFKQTQYLYLADRVMLAGDAGRLRLEFARWQLLFMALFFDVIHYNFGQSIMPMGIHFRDEKILRYSLFIRILIHIYTHAIEMFDVKLLKFFKKKIFVTFQGDDIRQGDFCRKNFEITFANEVSDSYYTLSSDQVKRKRILEFSKYADQIYALNPDLLYLLDRRARFLPYSHINLNQWQVISGSQNKIPVVLHAPSNRDVKGTKYILRAVDSLREKGLQFEFVLIEGMSNSEARKHYERADILVDQLLAGWYGGLAVELMALGKPVISFIREQDLKFVPELMRLNLPIINANPSSIEDILEEWILKDRGELNKRGMKSRLFVEAWHDPNTVAKIVIHQYGFICK